MTIYQFLQGRIVSLQRLNLTGATLLEGSVVYIQGSEFKVTTTVGLSDYMLAVIPEDIPNGEYGRGVIFGHAVKILLSEPGVQDQGLVTSTTAGEAKPITGVGTEGVFGILLENGTTEAQAIIWGTPAKTFTHDHDDLYYTQTELDGGQLDTRYYTETELNNGQLDTRYYTETELSTSGLASVHWDNLTNVPPLTPEQMIIFTLAGTLYLFTGALRFTNIFGVSRTISEVHLRVKDAPAGSDIIVDVHKNGSTIFTNQANRPQIAAGAVDGTTTTIDVATWADDEYLTIDIDQIGSTTPGGYLTVEIRFT